MAKYKLDMNDMQFPLYIETQSDMEAYEAFVALCDYNGIDEDDIEIVEQDDRGVKVAKVEVFDDELVIDEDYEGSVYEFTRVE